MRQGTRGAGTTAPRATGEGASRNACGRTPAKDVRTSGPDGATGFRRGRRLTPGVAGRRADDAAQFWKRSALPGQAQQEQLVTRQRSMLMRSFRNWSLITGVF